MQVGSKIKSFGNLEKRPWKKDDVFVGVDFAIGDDKTVVQHVDAECDLSVLSKTELVGGLFTKWWEKEHGKDNKNNWGYTPYPFSPEKSDNLEFWAGKKMEAEHSNNLTTAYSTYSNYTIDPKLTFETINQAILQLEEANRKKYLIDVMNTY